MRRRTAVVDSTTRWLAARDRTTGALLVLGGTLPLVLILAVLLERLADPPFAPGAVLAGVALLTAAASALCRLHEKVLARRLPPVPPMPVPVLGPASRAALRLRACVKGLAATSVLLALVALTIHLVLWALGDRPGTDDLFHRLALVGVALGLALIPVTRAVCRAEIDRRRTERLGDGSSDPRP